MVAFTSLITFILGLVNVLLFILTRPNLLLFNQRRYRKQHESSNQIHSGVSFAPGGARNLESYSRRTEPADRESSDVSDDDDRDVQFPYPYPPPPNIAAPPPPSSSQEKGVVFSSGNHTTTILGLKRESTGRSAGSSVGVVGAQPSPFANQFSLTTDGRDGLHKRGEGRHLQGAPSFVSTISDRDRTNDGASRRSYGSEKDTHPRVETGDSSADPLGVGSAGRARSGTVGVDKRTSQATSHSQSFTSPDHSRSPSQTPYSHSLSPEAQRKPSLATMGTTVSSGYGRANLFVEGETEKPPSPFARPGTSDSGFSSVHQYDLQTRGRPASQSPPLSSSHLPVMPASSPFPPQLNLSGIPSPPPRLPVPLDPVYSRSTRTRPAFSGTHIRSPNSVPTLPVMAPGALSLSLGGPIPPRPSTTSTARVEEWAKTALPLKDDASHP